MVPTAGAQWRVLPLISKIVKSGIFRQDNVPVN
jgi:hypothetical protein